MRLTLADYLIIIVYFLFVIGVGFLIKRKIKSSNDFLSSARNIPLWITSLAFISANLGAQEVIGMVASGAKYGIMTVFSSGVSLYALAKLLEIILHWDFDVSIWLAAGIVMAYTFLGGLTSAVYNEVLQFFLIVMGFAPLVI